MDSVMKGLMGEMPPRMFGLEPPLLRKISLMAHALPFYILVIMLLVLCGSLQLASSVTPRNQGCSRGTTALFLLKYDFS